MLLVTWLKKKMAAGCCGVKKQKLNESLPTACCSKLNDGNMQEDHSKLIIRPEMCYYCFDVLECHLFKHSQTYNPNFTNEALWVINKKYKSSRLILLFQSALCHLENWWGHVERMYWYVLRNEFASGIEGIRYYKVPIQITEEIRLLLQIFLVP